MTVKGFLTVIYLGLAFATFANGQYFPGRFNPQSQQSGSQFIQPNGPQNLIQPGAQFSGFIPNQGTNPQNIPQVPTSPFPSQGFSIPQVIDLISLFSQKPDSSISPQRDQSTFFAPQHPNSAPTPQRPSFTGNPQQQFYTGPQGPGSTFNNPQQTNPFLNHPQPINSFGPQRPDLLSTAPQSFNPSYTNRDTIPQQFNQGSAGPPPPVHQQSNPSYISPHDTIPISTAPQPPIQQQSNPSYTNPQDAIQKSTITQPFNQGSTGPQHESSAPRDSDSVITKLPNPDSTNQQQSNQDTAGPQQSNSDSTILQNTDSGSTGHQLTDSGPTVSQKMDPVGDNTQPISSASETSSYVSNAPQDTSSLSSVPQHSIHDLHGKHPSTKHRSRIRGHYNHPISGDPLRGERIVCLFNNKHFYRNGFTPSKLEPHLCTHLNYEFAILDPKTYEMMIGEPELDTDMNFYQEALDLKHINPKLKILVSLGGWSDSTKKYSELAADPAKRSNFIKKAIDFLQEHEFDGMDLAWEYPNCWQGAIGVSPKDKQNFVILLKETKHEFEGHGLLLSVSVGAIKREVEAAYDVPEITKYVDYINIMTYDMHGPWEPKTSHHVQFNAMPGDTDPYCNVKGGIQVWIDKGANKHKINMGLAFYGRTFRLTKLECAMGVPARGPGAAGPNTKEGGILNYNEICVFLNSGNWTEKEDEYAGFYACSGDQWACYDPPMMMVRKAKYVVESGLGGVLLKDLSGDDFEGKCFNMPFPLLKMVRMEIIHKIRQKYS